ncbi:MAG: oxidoreductase [Pseudomonadota bacterium]|nr:oxidoreductase [Pseudomonadota bacterium]
MNAPFLGKQGLHDNNSEFNSYSFLVEQILNRANTATLVKVVSVTNSGGVSPVGFVDIQPLVNLLDGYGNAVPHGVVHHVPYHRLQGGANAIILDPQVGDIGIAIFADRDISSVKNNLSQSNPGSLRRFDMADAMYMGGFLNGTPSQYIEFSASGIKVNSPTKITCIAPNIEFDANTAFAINSPTITLNGAVTQGAGSYAGNSSFAGTMTVNIDAVIGGKSYIHHIHSGVTSGSSDTGNIV